jgi:hypothetical protein
MGSIGEINRRSTILCYCPFKIESALALYIQYKTAAVENDLHVACSNMYMTPSNACCWFIQQQPWPHTQHQSFTTAEFQRANKSI